MTEPAFTNRLIHEKSPYLLQHAHNPVDWYPWGKEAFEAAKNLDRPIFLSIGYATCHWCHVMEEESFSNLEIARMMNETFINIKVDREEMPEVDGMYMEFAQALMSSAGGWPLNVILTPDLKPFFAVTYLPPDSRRGLIGLKQFMLQIKDLWQGDERKLLQDQADKIVEIFERAAITIGQDLPTQTHIENAIEMLFGLADPIFGGLKGEPKFPMGYQSTFLLEYARAKGDSRSLFCAELTFGMMARGGIYDHLGGGFSRYSVDERWMIPHFEKMLYDNAILARAYTEAWRYTKKESYKTVAQETLNYILCEMTDADGGFYSAEDADSDGHEGLFYTWTPQEVRDLLSPEDAGLFCQFYGVTSEGNFEGRSALHMALPIEEFAEVRKLDVKELESRLARCKNLLLKRRETRPHPFKDDKILTAWNGLTIDAFAVAAAAFHKPKYSDAAIKAAEFLKGHLWKEGKLLRRYRGGEARFDASLEDHAFLIKGLLTLFDHGFGTQWLEWALALTEILEKHFKVDGGAFYLSQTNGHLLIRLCEFYDGAEPSGNAVHAENLQRLYQITSDSKYLAQAEDIFKAVKTLIETYPPGMCYHLIALQRYFDKQAPTVVVALDEERSLEEEVRVALLTQFTPHLVTVWKQAKDPLLDKLAPSMVDKKTIDGQTAVYICRQDHCEAPLIDRDVIVQALKDL